MTTIDLTNARLLKNDVLIRLQERGQVEGFTIYIKEDADKDHTQFFEVLRVGPDVKHVKAGDIVVVPWTRITEPFQATFEGKTSQHGITSEDEIWAVVEE